METTPPTETVKTVVTARAGVPDCTTTPRGHVDIVIKAMAPVKIVLVRVLRTFIQSMLGFLGFLTLGAPAGATVGIMLPPMGAWDIIVAAAGLSLFPTVVSLLQNVLELLAKVDVNNPELRA